MKVKYDYERDEKFTNIDHLTVYERISYKNKNDITTLSQDERETLEELIMDRIYNLTDIHIMELAEELCCVL